VVAAAADDDSQFRLSSQRDTRPGRDAATAHGTGPAAVTRSVAVAAEKLVKLVGFSSFTVVNLVELT
jgi:hypothetical protein